MIWHQHPLVSGHFEMPPNALNTARANQAAKWPYLSSEKESEQLFFQYLGVLGGGCILCCSLPDSTAIQHHVDPDRPDLCAPHLTHLCSALVTTRVANGYANLIFCARWKEGKMLPGDLKG